ncbi:uncharacterized protein LOC129613207 [Condylostylus longicornis]|uniref:uncharacterized protein LOC129613207 n=1 Tax=Condylostylus longicornis TaxID=2530218 RepID=UPI00244E1AD6|nr:uncharacterized protein LOC129613207 [Condylostylus longicornis]
MTECSAKKWNVVNDNGELDRNKMIEKLKSSFTEEQWKLEKTEEIVDKCLVEAKEKLTNEKNECSQEALTMLHCIWKEFNQYCPKDLQVDSVKCNKLREKITKNDEAYLRLAHFHQLIHMYQKEE